MLHAPHPVMMTAAASPLASATSAATPAPATAQASVHQSVSISETGTGTGYGRRCALARRVVITGALALATCRTGQPAQAFALSPLAAGHALANGINLGLRPARWTQTRDAWITGSARSASFGRRKRRRAGGGRGPGAAHMSTSLGSGLGEMFKVPDERIIKAVEKAGNRAVPSDVAALAGVDISVAKKGLVNLANVIGGDLEVSKEGDVVYSFPTNIRASLLQQSATRRLAETFRGSWPVIFYGIRVAFGVALLASVAAIFATLFFVMTTANANSSSDRDDRRGGGGDFRGGSGSPMFRGGFNVFFGPSPLDLFFYRPYYGYYNTPRRQRGFSNGEPDEMGLLEAIFSYIFGDGDPDSNIGQRRIEAAARIIRENGGAVCAEQLAPLLNPERPPSSSNDDFKDESFVLPILTALEGSPEVTEDGDIVYVFPSLQTSAISGADLSSRWTNTAVPMPLMEEDIPFSVATSWKTVFAGVLGVTNLGGALYLRALLGQPALVGVTLPGYYGLVQGALPFLLTYAVALNAIPALRWLANVRENAAREVRNAIRRQWSERGKSGDDPVIRRKLRAARAMTTDLKVIKKEDVEYTTAKSLSDQKIPGDDDDLLGDFDARLKGTAANKDT